MPKKDFSNLPYLDKFFSDSYEVREDQTESKTRSRHIANNTNPKRHKLSLRIDAESKQYLERVSWESHKSVNQYITDLIATDKAEMESVPS